MLLAGEGGVRWLVHGREAVLNPWNYSPANVRVRGLLRADENPRVGYGLQPSWRGHFKGASFSTNALGMRNPDTTRSKPIGIFRIALLGASDVMGEAVSDEEVFARLLQRQLDRHRPGRYEILNLAVTGYDIALMVGSYEERVRPLEPDLVLLCLSYGGFFQPVGPMNIPDVRPPGWAEIPYWRDRSYLFTAGRRAVGRLGGLTPAATPAWDARLESLMEERDPEWRNARRSWISNADRVAQFARKRFTEGVSTALVTLPNPLVGTSGDLESETRFSRQLRSWARAAVERVVFDASPDIKEHSGWDDPANDFDSHPSAWAHAIYAEAIGSHLLDHLGIEN